jgi:hypothetical protein
LLREAESRAIAFVFGAADVPPPSDSLQVLRVGTDVLDADGRLAAHLGVSGAGVAIVRPDAYRSV